MISPFAILIILIALTMGLIAFVIIKPSITLDRGGKMLAFLALFLLPVLVGWMGTNEHIESSKKTEFCLSCHVMADHGKSLYVDDKEFVPANHFQNNLVPHDKACYTCHTDYTVYGDVNAKFRGLKHIYVYYLGRIPTTLKLYSSYKNRECLRCHEGMRRFEESQYHNRYATMLTSIKSNKLSCLTSNCHDVIHNVKELNDVEFWRAAVQ